MSKKVLFVDNSTRCFYLFRMPVAKALIASGYEVYVMSPLPYGEYVKRLEAAGVRHIPYEMGAKFSPLGDVKLLLLYRKVYHRLKPDYVIHYTIKPNIYGSLVAGMNKTPSLAVVPGTGSVFQNSGIISFIVKLLYKWAFRYPRKVWVLNKDDYSAFLAEKIVSRERLEVLPGEGIDTDSFCYKEYKRNSPFVFLYMGRMLREKGVEIIAKAVRKLHQDGIKDFEVRLLGLVEGLSNDVISENELRQWEEEGLVRFLGSCFDVRPVIAEADCILLPSFYGEGVPRSLMEACSTGRVVLTTDNVGCRDVVQDGYNGVLCHPRDVEDLASKMKMVLSIPEHELKSMGLNGREKMINEFAEHKIVKRYLDEIDCVLTP